MYTNQYRIYFLLAIFISSSPAYSEVYKCKSENGEITYTQKPCDNNSKRIELKGKIKGTYNGKPHEIEYEEVFNKEILEDFNVTEEADGTMIFTPKSGSHVTYE